MLASFQSLHGHDGVILIGSGHNHGIDALLFFVKHLPEISVDARLGILPGYRRGKAMVDVAQDFDPLARATLQVAATHSAHSDTRNTDCVARSLKAGATQDAPWDDERAHCRRGDPPARHASACRAVFFCHY